MGKRADSALRGIDKPWQMPQGGIDSNETPDQALIRELDEEIGLGIGDVEILGEYPEWLSYDFPDYLRAQLWGGKFKGQIQKWFYLQIKNPDTLFSLNTHHEIEFTECQWVKPDEILEMTVDFRKPTYEKLLAYLPHIFPQDHSK